MEAIKPHLWFNQEANEAAKFYSTLMPNSSVDYSSSFRMPSGGDCNVVEFTVAGQSFFGIDGGPGLEKNPSISFMIHFTPEEVALQDEAWAKLTKEGTVMMPLDKYPFSERYGWVSDKYGVSWQLIQRQSNAHQRSVIITSLMFNGAVTGRAEEAINFYSSIFTDSKPGILAPRPEDMGPDKKGTLMYGDFYIDKTWLAAMDSAHSHKFAFNDAISLLIPCDTQEEIDHYWSKLTEGGQPGQCGWLKDKFGVSWQVASNVMFNALKNGNQEQIDRVVAAFMKMSKVDSSILQGAFDGK